MSCLLFTNNATNAVLTANAQIPFGSVIHRKGSAITLKGNEVIARGGCNDYATVSGVVNCTATEVGEVTVTAYVDGVAKASSTVTATAAGDNVALPLTFAIKGSCCGVRRVTLGTDAAITLASLPFVFRTE